MPNDLELQKRVQDRLRALQKKQMTSPIKTSRQLSEERERESVILGDRLEKVPSVVPSFSTPKRQPKDDPENESPGSVTSFKSISSVRSDRLITVDQLMSDTRSAKSTVSSKAASESPFRSPFPALSHIPTSPTLSTSSRVTAQERLRSPLKITTHKDSNLTLLKTYEKLQKDYQDMMLTVTKKLESQQELHMDEIRTKNKVILDLEMELENVKTKSFGEIERKKKVIRGLKKQNKEIMRKLSEAEAENIEPSNEGEEEVKEEKPIFDNKRLLELEEHIHQLTDGRQDLMQKIADLNARNKQTHDENISIKEKQVVLERDNEEKEKKIAQLDHSIEQAVHRTKILENLEIDNQEQSVRIKDLERSIETQLQEISILKKRETELAELQEQYSILHTRYNHLLSNVLDFADTSEGK
ncbi:hypothetical protein PCE1_002617 [Barthelona sp. PCE]